MFFFRSLRAKTVATALIPTAVVFLAVAIIALYAYDQVSRDAERVVQGRDSELARITAARLSEALSQHSRVLQSTAADDDVLAAWAAETSPRLWPTTASGTMPQDCHKVARPNCIAASMG